MGEFNSCDSNYCLKSIFSLSESTKMEGNDFIIFKHGCGNDSTYGKGWTGWTDHSDTGFSDEAKAKMEKPCENFTFYHVEVEYVGDESYTYKYYASDEETQTDKPSPEDDPIIFKIRSLQSNISDESSKQEWKKKCSMIVHSILFIVKQNTKK